jgi:hypothetical protein
MKEKITKLFITIKKELYYYTPDIIIIIAFVIVFIFGVIYGKKTSDDNYEEESIEYEERCVILGSYIEVLEDIIDQQDIDLSNDEEYIEYKNLVDSICAF